jgi:predicted NACHT family NTPase
MSLDELKRLPDESLDVFLGKRQQARGLSLDPTPTQKKHVLAPLAYQMMCNRHREVTVADAVKAISDPLQKVSPLTTGEEFLTMVENSSGLLLEREIGVYSFAHLTVQEYLAAVHIQVHQLENDLIQQLGNTGRAFFARLLQRSISRPSLYLFLDAAESQFVAGLCHRRVK